MNESKRPYGCIRKWQIETQCANAQLNKGMGGQIWVELIQSDASDSLTLKPT